VASRASPLRCWHLNLLRLHTWILRCVPMHMRRQGVRLPHHLLTPREFISVQSFGVSAANPSKHSIPHRPPAISHANGHDSRKGAIAMRCPNYRPPRRRELETRSDFGTAAAETATKLNCGRAHGSLRSPPPRAHKEKRSSSEARSGAHVVCSRPHSTPRDGCAGAEWSGEHKKQQETQRTARRHHGSRRRQTPPWRVKSPTLTTRGCCSYSSQAIAQATFLTMSPTALVATSDCEQH